MRRDVDPRSTRLAIDAVISVCVVSLDARRVDARGVALGGILYAVSATTSSRRARVWRTFCASCVAWFVAACALSTDAMWAWRGTCAACAHAAGATVGALAGGGGERDARAGGVAARARRIVLDGRCDDAWEVVERWECVGVALGAWLGACAIPLDWGRPWQRWPTSVARGVAGGKLAGISLGLALARFADASEVGARKRRT